MLTRDKNGTRLIAVILHFTATEVLVVLQFVILKYSLFLLIMIDKRFAKVFAKVYVLAVAKQQMKDMITAADTTATCLIMEVSCFVNVLINDDIQPLLDSATEDLFCKMKISNHCLHPLLPPDRTLNQVFRTRGHSFQLPTSSFNLHKKSFVISCLFKLLT